MSRILLLATTTGYQTRSFGEAADELGVELVFATDRCHQIDDPWRDGAIAIRFHEEEQAARAIAESARERPLDGLLALGDRPTVIAALAAQHLGLPGNTPAAAAASRNKRLTRERLRAAGLPCPSFTAIALDAPIPTVRFPCVVKPLALSGSRGVIRANDTTELASGIARVRRLLGQPDVQVMRDALSDELIVEDFIPGREYALEGVLDSGRLQTLAIFDKPDPLDGPFFEETIYLTPIHDSSDGAIASAVETAVQRAVVALGLSHGPIHAECRVDDSDVFVLEVAARPIGGLCARALRLVERESNPPITLEHLLLRHARGEPIDRWRREPSASGVMMIPIPAGGTYRRVDGLDAARSVDHIEDVRITAKPDQRLVPLPEGASYLGFIFARADTSGEVERALREAYARLKFVIERDLLVRA